MYERTGTRAARVPLVAAILTPLLAASVPGQQVERFSLTGDVAIFNVAGSVTIEPGTANGVVVEITRGGADAERLRIDSGELRGWQTLRVIYPDDRVVYPRLSGNSRTSFGIAEDGTFGRRWGGGDDRDPTLLSLLRLVLGEHDDDRITVSGGGRGMEAYADMRVLVPAGRTVAVHLGVGEVDATNIEGNLVVDTRSGRIDASSLRGSARLATGSGTVQLQGAEGDVVIDTGSGGIRVAEVSGSRLSVDTGSGSVDGLNLASADVEIDTGSGSVDLSGVRADRLGVDTGSGGISVAEADVADLDLDTGSGSVRVAVRNSLRNVRIDTGSGGVTLTVPQGFGASIDLSTGSGGISSDLPVQISHKGRRSLRGQIGDGSGSVFIETGSGSIRIRSH